MKKFKKEWPFHLMLLPAVIMVIIFNYVPMAGVSLAFLDYKPAKGLAKAAFVGWKQFETLFENPNFFLALKNTVIIAGWKLITGLIVPLVLALLLNEIRKSWYKRVAQTLIYLPYFISWVLMAGIIVDIFSPTDGLVNRALESFGVEPIYFLGSNTWARFTMILTNIWKEAGWGTIIFMAALTGVDLNLYEAAVIDGAGRLKQMQLVTIPAIVPTIVLVGTLSLSNVLNAGFDQIYNLMTGVTMETLDIIDTLVYRIGVQNGQFSLATAAGLFKSVVSSFFIILSYRLADKLAGYKIF